MVMSLVEREERPAYIATSLFWRKMRHPSRIWVPTRYMVHTHFFRRYHSPTVTVEFLSYLFSGSIKLCGSSGVRCTTSYITTVGGVSSYSLLFSQRSGNFLSWGMYPLILDIHKVKSYSSSNICYMYIDKIVCSSSRYVVNCLYKNYIVS